MYKTLAVFTPEDLKEAIAWYLDQQNREKVPVITLSDPNRITFKVSDGRLIAVEAELPLEIQVQEPAPNTGEKQ
jgi:hypothetical protein